MNLHILLDRKPCVSQIDFVCTGGQIRMAVCHNSATEHHMPLAKITEKFPRNIAGKYLRAGTVTTRGRNSNRDNTNK